MAGHHHDLGRCDSEVLRGHAVDRRVGFAHPGQFPVNTASHGGPPCFQILATVDMSAFDSAATAELFLGRVSPGTTSGPGTSRRQANVSPSRPAAEKSVMPYSPGSDSRASRDTEWTVVQFSRSGFAPTREANTQHANG